jgi:hypothetical protein
MADNGEQLDQVWMTGIRSSDCGANHQWARSASHLVQKVHNTTSSKTVTPHTQLSAWQAPIQNEPATSRTVRFNTAAEAQTPPVHRLLSNQEGRSNQAMFLTNKYDESCLSVLLKHGHTRICHGKGKEASPFAVAPSSAAVWQWSEEMLDLSPRELEAALATMPALRQDQRDQLSTARIKKRNKMYARRSRARKREIRLQQGVQKGYSQKIGALKMHNAALRSFLENSALRSSGPPPNERCAI